MKAFALSFFFLALASWADARPSQGVRAMGMGGAYIAVAEDPSSAISNPAGMASGIANSLEWSQARLSFDTREYLVLASYKPLSTSAFGGALIVSQLSQDNVQDFRIVLDANGNPVIDPLSNQPQKQILGFYTRYNSQLGLALGFGLGRHLQAGLALKGGLANSGAAVSQGLGGDVGLLFRTGPARFAVVAQDLGNLPEPMADGSMAVKRPLLGLGTAWELISKSAAEKGPIWWRRPLLVSVQTDGRLPWTSWTQGRFGLEWQPFDLLAVRLGGGDQELNFGASLRIMKVQVDFATVGGNLSQANRVALRYDF